MTIYRSLPETVDSPAESQVRGAMLAANETSVLAGGWRGGK